MKGSSVGVIAGGGVSEVEGEPGAVEGIDEDFAGTQADASKQANTIIDTRTPARGAIRWVFPDERHISNERFALYSIVIPLLGARVRIELFVFSICVNKYCNNY
jgi:hypothetical protein